MLTEVLELSSLWDVYLRVGWTFIVIWRFTRQMNVEFGETRRVCLLFGSLPQYVAVAACRRSGRSRCLAYVIESRGKTKQSCSNFEVSPKQLYKFTDFFRLYQPSKVNAFQPGGFESRFRNNFTDQLLDRVVIQSVWYNFLSFLCFIPLLVHLIFLFPVSCLKDAFFRLQFPILNSVSKIVLEKSWDDISGSNFPTS